MTNALHQERKASNDTTSVPSVVGFFVVVVFLRRKCYMLPQTATVQAINTV